MSIKLTEIAGRLHTLSNKLNELKDDIIGAALSINWAEAELQAAAQEKPIDQQKQRERLDKYNGSFLRTWAHWCLLNDTKDPSNWCFYPEVPLEIRDEAIKQLTINKSVSLPIRQYRGVEAAKVLRNVAAACERGQFL